MLLHAFQANWGFGSPLQIHQPMSLFQVASTLDEQYGMFFNVVRNEFGRTGPSMPFALPSAVPIKLPIITINKDGPRVSYEYSCKDLI